MTTAAPSPAQFQMPAPSSEPREAALAALAELVDLKRLIARVDETRLEGGLRVPAMNIAEADAAREEYQRRKPAAWARAFEIVDAARGASHGN
jgi:nucleoside phosphorylase